MARKKAQLINVLIQENNSVNRIQLTKGLIERV